MLILTLTLDANTVLFPGQCVLLLRLLKISERASTLCHAHEEHLFCKFITDIKHLQYIYEIGVYLDKLGTNV